MQLEVGAIVEGKVIRITKFGAFVEFENGKSGLVHISEVSNNFVKQVEDYLKVGDSVKVKILSISDNGKIELSRKKAEIESNATSKVGLNSELSNKNNISETNKFVDKFKKRFNDNSKGYTRDNFNGSFKNKDNSNFSDRSNTNKFEDMLNKFKKLSEEKLAGFEKTKSRRGRNTHKDNCAE